MINTPQSIQSSQQQTGFTLVEVMVVLAVVAIIVGAATPSLISIIANNRVATASQELITTLNLAKSEAIKAGVTTVLCKRDTDSLCDTDSSSGWSKGWVLFVDDNDDNIIDTDERIIHINASIDASLDFAGTTRLMNFNPNGRASAGHFCLRNTHDDAKSRTIIVSPTGRFRTETVAYDC